MEMGIHSPVWTSRIPVLSLDQGTWGHCHHLVAADPVQCWSNRGEVLFSPCSALAPVLTEGLTSTSLLGAGEGAAGSLAGCTGTASL